MMPIAHSLLRLLSKSLQGRTHRGKNVLLKADSAVLGGCISLSCRHRVRSFHVLLSVGRSRRIESGHTASRRSPRKTVITRTQAGESGKTPSSGGGRSGSFGRGRPDVSDVSADQNPPASVPQRPRARRPWLGCPAPVLPDAQHRLCVPFPSETGAGSDSATAAAHTRPDRLSACGRSAMPRGRIAGPTPASR